VAAAVVAALVLPTSGKSPPTMAAVAIGYVAVALTFGAFSRATRAGRGSDDTRCTPTLKSGANCAVVRR
jgi:hypothetical protein